VSAPALEGPAGGAGRRLARWFHRRPRAALAALVAAPTLWLVLAYVGSLVALLATSLYRVDDFTSSIVRGVGLHNFQLLFRERVYRAVTLRTVAVAAAVTVIDLVVALPIAFYLAKVASPRVRSFAAVAVLLPLWASYLVKAYAWRAIVTPSGGVLDRWFGGTPGFGGVAVTLTLAYLWLPYMILPVFAGLERLPASLLDASADLGGRAGRTFVSVVVPLVKPSIVAGSIFTFSLSLGDYIAVRVVGGTQQMLGGVVYANFVDDLPLAAAYACVPVVLMVVYLSLARRTGAFENL
jgi:putative spermidine/putrescine transport system permease protein